MKKSLICLVLVLAMLMLGACGGEEPKIELPDKEELLADVTTAPQEETETEPEQTEEPTEPEVEETPVEPITVEEPDIRDITVTVTEVGTIDYVEDMRFASDMPVARVYDENEVAIYTLYSYLGEDLMGKTYNNYDYFGDGLTAAYTYSEDIPQCSLINVNTGDVYLEDEACKVEQLSDRFYYVIYATEQTDSKEDAFIYFTDSMFSIMPDEDDVLYKGYAKIFDLEAGSFVGDVVLDEPCDVEVCGSTICIEVDWDTCDIYAADGTCLGDGVPTVTVCQDLMVQETDDGTVIYDSEFNQLRVLPEGATVDEESDEYPCYSNKYLKVYNSDEYPYLYGLTDMGGNPVLEKKYYSVYKTYGDYVFVGAKEEDEYLYGVILADGTEILPCQYEGAYMVDGLPLIRYYDFEDNDYIYIPGVGSINEAEYKKTSDVYYSLVNEDDYSTCNYLVYGTGETVTYTDADVITGVLLWCEDGLMEMINGEILIAAEDFDYDQVISTDEYLYCYNRATGQYTVYRYEMG